MRLDMAEIVVKATMDLQVPWLMLFFVDTDDQLFVLAVYEEGRPKLSSSFKTQFKVRVVKFVC